MAPCREAHGAHQALEPRLRDRREERALAREVAVGRGLRDTGLPGGAAQRHAQRALTLEQGAGALDQRRAKVAVMVRGPRARPRTDGSPHGRWMWQQMLTESTSVARC